eukprot:scaffold30123_cov84-Phaeocystis_antarctica.AAC.1
MRQRPPQHGRPIDTSVLCSQATAPTAGPPESSPPPPSIGGIAPQLRIAARDDLTRTATAGDAPAPQA